MNLWFAFKRLLLGFALIIIAAGILLVSDWNGNPSLVTAAKPLNRIWQVSIVRYIDSPAAEDTEQGLLDGFRESGLVDGRDYKLSSRSAQGDIATLNGIVEAVRSDGTDLMIVLSTPTLQTAAKKIQKMPIVFALIANAFIAGAGRTNEDHLPNVTGSTILSPFEEMVALVREVLPNARSCGTVFTPAEVNSAYNHDAFVETGLKANLEITSVAATSSSDVSDAALALTTRKIDAVCQISDNLTSATFTTIANAARRAKLPVFSFNSPQVNQGAHIVLSRDFRDGGRESALLAARIMQGESPATIPFKPTTRTRLLINTTTARSAGLTIPRPVLERADELIK